VCKRIDFVLLIGDQMTNKSHKRKSQYKRRDITKQN